MNQPDPGTVTRLLQNWRRGDQQALDQLTSLVYEELRRMARGLMRGERPIIRSDGKYIRDYFYVCDAAQAYLRLAERLPDAKFQGQAFNFGNEIPEENRCYTCIC